MKKNYNALANTNIEWNKNDYLVYRFRNTSGKEDKHEADKRAACVIAGNVVAFLRRDARGNINSLHWEKMPIINGSIKDAVRNHIQRYIHEHGKAFVNTYYGEIGGLTYDEPWAEDLALHLVVNDYLPRTKWAICNHPCIIKDVA